MILEKFFTHENDNQLLFINPDVTFGEFKRLVLGQKLEFEKSEIQNVVLFCDDYLDFSVNFFASVFAHKKMFFLTDKNRLKQLDFDYILPADYSPCDGEFEGDFDAKNIDINLFTSGSTGVPKNIRKTLYNMETEALFTIKDFNLEPNMTVVSTTSSAHSFGMTFNFMLPFAGNYKINRKKIEYPEQLDIEDKYIFISTPSFMEKLAKYDFAFENSPQIIFLAGAKLKEEIYSYFAKFAKVVDIYGSTETGNIAYKCGGDVFTVMGGVEVYPDEDGRITVKSEFFPADKMVLNDVIEKKSESKFVLKKRVDRIVKILEKRISLDELENNLSKHKDIQECYCFAYADKLCCAVASHNPEVKPSELKKYLSNFSEILPKKWRILDEIPRTVSGKIDKVKLNKIFGSNLSYPSVYSRHISESQAEVEILFRKNSNFLKGHFDITPIIPGVIQLYYARFFAEDVFGIELSQEEVKKVKFSNIMRPDNRVTLKLINKEKSVEFTYVADDKIFSSGIFVK